MAAAAATAAAVAIVVRICAGAEICYRKFNFVE